MFGKIRPFIFKFDPETAHNLAIQALKFNLMPRNQKQNFKHIETEIFNKKIQKGLVPDVVGMGLIDAVYVLEKLGLLVQPVGSGIVRKQSVKAGYRINKGQKIILQLG